MMLVSVLVWFQCYTAVMTSDKFIYLFGRIIPALSLVLSMAMRFVPKFTNQLHVVAEAQRCLGRDVSEGTVWQRTKTAITILSILVTWALENAIETADSMKSRGYGLPGRTAFSIYRLDSRDKMLLMWLGFCGFFICSGWMAGGFYWRCYPTVKFAVVTPLTITMQICYLALCLAPVMLDRKEEQTWKHLQENMDDA